uniref:Ig-like domain-containing protein n=1 Tax=Oryzias latipes TaxID=8090 RepID=A0A3B3HXX9_ORYLA
MLESKLGFFRRGLTTVFIIVNMGSLIRGKVSLKSLFGQSCILPCRFTPGDDLVIHWFKMTPTNTKVHSYYDNKDHLEHQHQRFRGRTSLFQNQISKGNASLQLTGVMVQDEGPYRCLTSTITETGEFDINMKVYGTRNPENWRKSKCFSSVSPIHCILPCSFTPGDYLEIYWVQLTPTQAGFHSYYDNKDHLEHQHQRFRGRTSLFQDQISKGNASLFPAGDETVIHWIQMTSPEKPAHSFYYNTDQLQRQHQGFRGRTSLFQEQISRGNASLLLSGVRVEDEGRYRCYSSVLAGNHDISCPAVTDATFLIWRFNHSEEIVRGKAGGPHSPPEKWKKHIVESSSEKLTLKHLQPSLTGIYTCEIRNDTGTFIRSSDVLIIEGKVRSSLVQSRNVK